jgi:hypothetical protein
VELHNSQDTPKLIALKESGILEIIDPEFFKVKQGQLPLNPNQGQFNTGETEGARLIL